MNIPLKKLLIKMEAELQGAKTASSDSALRERIHSLKTLCELVLDEPVRQNAPQPSVSMTPVQPSRMAHVQPSYQMPSQIQQPSISNQSKKIEMDDGANGDSLLDF